MTGPDMFCLIARVRSRAERCSVRQTEQVRACVCQCRPIPRRLTSKINGLLTFAVEVHPVGAHRPQRLLAPGTRALVGAIRKFGLRRTVRGSVVGRASEAGRTRRTMKSKTRNTSGNVGDRWDAPYALIVFCMGRAWRTAIDPRPATSLSSWAPAAANGARCVRPKAGAPTHQAGWRRFAGQRGGSPKPKQLLSSEEQCD